ncbi:Bug family tripartite tricarboxylate transporter substrate binding protein [Comamonas serinivorans]|nr:tripartite tricarboxylate transporter substrate binding protein [Comamonas serinivorans]
MPMTRRRAAALMGMAPLMAAPSLRAADVFPSKPITLVVGFGAGGGTDVQARALAKAASMALGQSIVIENRPGLSATLGASQVAQRAAPDGYSLCMTPATLFRLPHLQKVPFDPLKDFTYIANITAYTFGITVPQESPFKSVKDLVAFGRANPGKLSYGTTGKGGTSHLMMLRLEKMTGAQFNMVPFKSSTEIFSAVLGGHVDFSPEAAFGTHVNGGKLRSLGIFLADRVPSRPDTPTLREQGFDLVAKSSWGIGGPAGMDPKIIQVLQDAFQKASQDSDFKRMLMRDDQPALFMDSPTYTRYAHDLYAEEGKYVRELGVKVE